MLVFLADDSAPGGLLRDLLTSIPPASWTTSRALCRELRRAVDARRHTARLRSGRASTAARGAGLGRRRTGGTRGDGARGDVEPLGTCVKIDQRVRLSWELFASRYLGTAAMLPAELAPL